MAIRYVDQAGVFLLPQPSDANPDNISGAVQQLMGAWLDADLNSAQQGWVSAADRQGRTGFVRLAMAQLLGVRQINRIQQLVVDMGKAA